MDSTPPSFVVLGKKCKMGDLMTILMRFDGADFCSVAFSDNQVSTGYPSGHSDLDHT